MLRRTLDYIFASKKARSVAELILREAMLRNGLEVRKAAEFCKQHNLRERQYRYTIRLLKNAQLLRKEQRILQEGDNKRRATFLVPPKESPMSPILVSEWKEAWEEIEQLAVAAHPTRAHKQRTYEDLAPPVSSA
jgi:hypothetical protein